MTERRVSMSAKKADAVKANHYETFFVFKSDITDANAEAILSKLESVVTRFSGKVITKDDWGLRELAYPIEGETMGRYNVVVYSGTSGVVEEIERHFKILPEVV